jgi:hypothetical protein
MTNDLGQFLLITLGLYGGIATLLFLLAAVDPQTSRTGLARPKAPSADGLRGAKADGGSAGGTGDL